MANLLEVDEAAVGEVRLVSLAKDWVQRLQPIVRWIDVGKASDHHLLQPVDGVVREGGSTHVERSELADR